MKMVLWAIGVAMVVLSGNALATDFDPDCAGWEVVAGDSSQGKPGWRCVRYWPRGEPVQDSQSYGGWVNWSAQVWAVQGQACRYGTSQLAPQACQVVNGIYRACADSKGAGGRSAWAEVCKKTGAWSPSVAEFLWEHKKDALACSTAIKSAKSSPAKATGGGGSQVAISSQEMKQLKKLTEKAAKSGLVPGVIAGTLHQNEMLSLTVECFQEGSDNPRCTKGFNPAEALDAAIGSLEESASSVEFILPAHMACYRVLKPLVEHVRTGAHLPS